MTKQQQRTLIKDRLAYLMFDYKKANQIINVSLKNLKEIEDKRVFFTYNPLKNEVDITDFNNMLDEYKIASFPVCKTDSVDAYISKSDYFVEGPFGIKQPDVSKSMLLDKSAIEVAIIPCLAFDENLNRLGHGKGYYDKFLQGCDCLKIGVAFELNKLEKVMTDDHDIKMDMIITEKGIYYRKFKLE